jgi:hypothetical protein
MRSDSSGEGSAPQRRRRGTRRTLGATAVVVTSLLLASCTPHHVALNYKCPGLSAHEARVLSRRGAVGLGRVGVTPGGLKLLQKCQIN